MSTTRQDTRDGVLVGLLAYAAVAAFYSIFDVLAGRGLLFTVNVLGRAVFRGLRDPIVLQYPVAIDDTAIFLYNGMHLVLSLGIGVVVMRLVGEGERNRARARSMLMLIIGGFVATIAVVGELSIPIRPVLPWWSIVLANSLAVALAALYVIRQRPGVFGRLAHAGPAGRRA